LERPFVYVFKFPFHSNVCMLTLSLLINNNKKHQISPADGEPQGGR
jgi:hypothetical protein